METDDPARGIRFAIFTVDLPESNAITQQVISHFPGQVSGLICSRSLQHGKRTWESLKYLVPRSAPLLASKALEKAACRVAAPALRMMGRVPRTAPLQQIAQAHDLPLRSTNNVNSSFLRELLESSQTDLIVSIYMNQILQRDLIDAMPLGAINVHPALLPNHRGIFPYVWAMAEDDQHTGVTVHWIDERIDTGAIIQQQSTPIHPGESMLSLSHRCADIAAELLVTAIADIQQGSTTCLEQPSQQGSYHSWPDRDCLRRCRQNRHPLFTVGEIWQQLSRTA
jgi:folate-dependent phosphoribosylglycinamide formyltransferase PurN